MRRDIDTELVVDGVPDKRLGEYGAVQMAMKLAALRHAFEEIMESERIAAQFIKRFGGMKLGLAQTLLSKRRHRRSEDCKRNGNCDDCARDPHGAFS